ncbi:MAG: transglutaminase-like domain-containing protein [Thermoanaerobaculales bacterium]
MRVIFFFLVLLSATAPWASEAEYLAHGRFLPIATASNGYVQEVRTVADGGVEVRVTATHAPIGATGSYTAVAGSDRPAIPAGFFLPPQLLAKLRPEIGAWDAATRILEWTADRVKVDSSERGPQDAVSVLARGRGRCSGLANSAVALLRTAGFEARTVSGLLIADDGPIRHRWLECRLPGAGWVPSDPTFGLWIVTARHVTFADTVVQIPEIRVLRGRENGLESLPRRGSRVLRPNQGADLICRLSTVQKGVVPVAVLRGGDGDVRRALLDPEARFSGLLPGRWILEIMDGGVVVERQELILRSGDVHSYVVSGLSGSRPKEVGS